MSLRKRESDKNEESPARRHDAADEDDSSCLIEKEFASTTTCSGMSFWCSSTNKIQQIFWVLLVIGKLSTQHIFTLC